MIPIQVAVLPISLVVLPSRLVVLSKALSDPPAHVFVLQGRSWKWLSITADMRERIREAPIPVRDPLVPLAALPSLNEMLPNRIGERAGYLAQPANIIGMTEIKNGTSPINEVERPIAAREPWKRGERLTSRP